MVIAGSIEAAPASDAFADRLTGDWAGARNGMADHGVTFDLDSTNYYQGLLEGAGDHSFDYGGRFDAYLNFDTGRLGWWSGGQLRAHAEYFFGDLDSNLGGTVASTNLGMRLPNPGDPEDLVVTNISLAQRLNETMSLIVGKINTVDLLANDPFFGGAGTDRFLNVAFAAPPNGLVPPVIIGGILSVRQAPVVWTFMVYDPEDRTRDYLPGDLFDTGVNVSASVRYGTTLAGRTSSIALTAIYSTADALDLRDVLLPPGLETGIRSDSWHVGLHVSHFLRESAVSPGDGWGLFVRMGASDGNPNPFQAWISGGIGGRGLFASRPDDRFGIGYFYYSLSDDLQRAVAPFTRVDNEQGIETFYDLPATPWLRVAIDLQYVNPATADQNAFVAGVRAKIQF